jgi:hypothetical protein
MSLVGGLARRALRRLEARGADQVEIPDSLAIALIPCERVSAGKTVTGFDRLTTRAAIRCIGRCTGALGIAMRAVAGRIAGPRSIPIGTPRRQISIQTYTIDGSSGFPSRVEQNAPSTTAPFPR